MGQERSNRAPLSITTSSSSTASGSSADTTNSQSAGSTRGQGALPPPYPQQRTSTEPYPSPTQSYSSASPIMPGSRQQRRQTMPHSAGMPPPSSPFSRSGGTTPKSPRTVKAERRHSFEPNKMNVYTECGRHGDEWLFGGFTVAGAFRKVIGGKKEEKEERTEEESRGRGY
ncbi:hypothetical protein G7Y89_g5252 [Cudoniella acicularis]|uniref:Uncharacterized protein n=1 Tax=Cudoniella acicularis TaxID=354080 RepID=A0A8H4RPZ9_9HELO|nr:hypothetical protein G7Y89_g5252 [Cudoniella acicularis]